ncbi:hypothetical protein BGZ57DRAFT_984554 [Hyaloscypha finlandica]|nr:hypothetical protein BGZ57DRAFT_984554 [Hyaloscypha finlandica]
MAAEFSKNNFNPNCDVCIYRFTDLSWRPDFIPGRCLFNYIEIIANWSQKSRLRQGKWDLEWKTVQDFFERRNVTITISPTIPEKENSKKAFVGTFPAYLIPTSASQTLGKWRQATLSTAEFQRQVVDADLTSAQLGPLNQRLDALESFMPKTQTDIVQTKIAKKGMGKAPDKDRNLWTSEPGCLTAIDLSCPCVTPEGACSLFTICLSLFLEQHTSVGRVVALDEAHKYMDASVEVLTFTNTLLATVRLQRHLGAQIIVSTQEPTISPALLDLCSVTIVHRFTSPATLSEEPLGSRSLRAA